VIKGDILEELITVEGAEFVRLRLHLGKLMQFIREWMRLFPRILIITDILVDFHGFLLEKGDERV
jgi:hypothetical protein